ncbi:MAG: hypothetical protein ACQERF_10080, partial [Actinomycetota bacterium]
AFFPAEEGQRHCGGDRLRPGHAVRTPPGGPVALPHVIVNERAEARRELPGSATPRSVVAVTGEPHPVTVGDRRRVVAHVG